MTKLIPWLGTSLFLTMASLVTIATAGQGREPLKMGVVLPLTGASQKFGEIQKNAFFMGGLAGLAGLMKKLHKN